MKNKNYKYLIGLIIGFLLVTSVYGASNIMSSDVIYDSANNNYSSGDFQGAIDDLAEKMENVRPISCPSGIYCVPYKYELAVGDYVYYKPAVKSYPVNTSITGYTGTVDQIIYPEELELWRVLNINSNGTIDLISEYVSSTDAAFEGQKGYLNLVGYLNVLAEQYETEGITVGSRYFGFNGQTEYIEDTDPTSIFVNPALYTCSTGGTCNPDPDDNEDKGGGDTLYITDFDRVNTVLGTRVAYRVKTTTATSYWMASRQYIYSKLNGAWSNHVWRGRMVNNSGALSFRNFYYYGSNVTSAVNNASALRPIVILKSGLSYEGLGTKDIPMKIVTG